MGPSCIFAAAELVFFQLYSQLIVQAMVDIYIRIKSFYYQVLCFDLRPTPSDITENEKTVKSQEEPCTCPTATTVSVSITVTFSVTACFYLILKCKSRFSNR